MEKMLSEIERLQLLITSEWMEYRLSIRNDRPFEEVKIIYVHIKELQKQADNLMQRANELHATEQ